MNSFITSTIELFGNISEVFCLSHDFLFLMFSSENKMNFCRIFIVYIQKHSQLSNLKKKPMLLKLFEIQEHFLTDAFFDKINPI